MKRSPNPTQPNPIPIKNTLAKLPQWQPQSQRPRKGGQGRIVIAWHREGSWQGKNMTRHNRSRDTPSTLTPNCHDSMHNFDIWCANLTTTRRRLSTVAPSFIRCRSYSNSRSGRDRDSSVARYPAEPAQLKSPRASRASKSSQALK